MSKSDKAEHPAHAKVDSHGDHSGAPSHHSEKAAAGDKLRSEFQTTHHETKNNHPSTGDKHAADKSISKPATSHAPDSTHKEARHIDVTPIKSVLHSPDASHRHVTIGDVAHSVAELVKQGVFKRADDSHTTTHDKTDSPAKDSVRASVTLPESSAVNREIKPTDGIPNKDKVEAKDKVNETETRKEPVEKIKVVYSDQANDPSQRVSNPDFKVKKDGTVEVVHDPDKNNKKEIVIEVEREQGQITRPTEAQQKAIDGLTGYLAERLMKKSEDGAKSGVIEDKQGLVSDKVKSTAKSQPTPEQSLPEPTRHQVENMSRFNGGGRGTLSSEQADSYFPPREVPRLPGENDQQASVKDVVAGMATAGESHPYEATRDLGDRGTGVGRYMLAYDLLNLWLSDLGLGEPPDPAKLQEAIKKGIISADLAKKLQSAEFKEFLDKLKHGQKPSIDEIKSCFPKELQERIGGDLTDKFSKTCKDAQGNINVGKVALAMQIGHIPNQQEMEKPEYKSFMEAAERLYTISDARTRNPGQALEWQEVNNRLLVAAKQHLGEAVWAKSGYNAADLEYGNLGCAASVSKIMKYAGVDSGMRSAGVVDLESQILRQGGKIVPNPQPGDIVIGLSAKSGHIGIVGENGTVYHNSSSRRAWTHADLNAVFGLGRFSDVHFLRLPNQNA